MSEPLAEQPTLFAEASRVRMYPWPDAARAWLESDQDFGSSFIAFFKKLSRHGLSSRMSPAFYPATEDGTLPSSFEGWSNSGMASLGGYLTLNTSEWPKDAAVCSLSDILETDVPQKFYLSPKACRGILRRAKRRGKELPRSLAARTRGGGGLGTDAELRWALIFQQNQRYEFTMDVAGALSSTE